MTEAEQKEIFKNWLDRHKALIFKVVRAYTCTAASQDDLFQEITIQVWHSVPSFREESAVTTWIYRISLNTAIKWSKKERKHNPVEKLEPVQHILEETKVPPDERLNWLYSEIYKLDEIDRCVTLLMLDSLSYKEMSAILGISESHVGVKINRIKKHLIEESKKLSHHGVY